MITNITNFLGVTTIVSCSGRSTKKAQVARRLRGVVMCCCTTGCFGRWLIGQAVGRHGATAWVRVRVRVRGRVRLGVRVRVRVS